MTYPGMVNDVLIVTYLCWLSHKDARKIGRMTLDDAADKIDDWADEIGMLYPSALFSRAATLVSGMFFQEPEGTPVDEGDNKSDAKK